MRLFGAAILAGIIWSTVGCSTSQITPLMRTAQSALNLKDSGTGMEYQVDVMNGALTVQAVADVQVNQPELVDEVTGVTYLLGMTGGGLTLAPQPGGEIGMAEIELADTVSPTTYALSLSNGTLTLTSVQTVGL